METQDYFFLLNPLVPTPQNGQTHSNNSSATVDELFDPFLWLALKWLRFVREKMTLEIIIPRSD